MGVSTLLRWWPRRRVAQRRRWAGFESLEPRNMPALVIDIGHHFVEPNAAGQRVSIEVRSTNFNTDPGVNSFSLKAQIGDSGPVFESVNFSGGMWAALPHAEFAGPLPGDPHLAQGLATFGHQVESLANGTLVNFHVDSSGIPFGSFELRLTGTRIGSSEFRNAAGEAVPTVIINGTIQVRSAWQNPAHVGDVNGDGYVSPLDLLIIINLLNKHGSGPLPMPSPLNKPPPYVDVDGNGERSPLDALVLINCLNNPQSCSSVPLRIPAVVKPEVIPEEREDQADSQQPPLKPDEPARPEFTPPPPPDDTEEIYRRTPMPMPYMPNELAWNAPTDFAQEALIDELFDLGLDWQLFSRSELEAALS